MVDLNGTGGQAPRERDAIDDFLDGLQTSIAVDLGGGRTVTVRPLMLGESDPLYDPKLRGDQARFQAYLMAHSVWVGDTRLGDRASRLPLEAVGKIMPHVLKANGLTLPVVDAGESDAEPIDPKSPAA